MNIIEHQTREKEVVDSITEIATEGNIIFLRDDKGNDRISQRIQMIIAFTVMDVMANYWYEYLGKSTNKPSEKTCLWYETFCMTDENRIYRKDNQWKLFNSSRMYKFRNSLVHFWGLSETTDGTYISLAPNDMPDSEKNKLIEAFKNRGSNTIIIKPSDFYTLVKEGGIVMLNSWVEAIRVAQKNQSKTEEYIKNIERVWAKFKREGAVKIYKPKEQLK